MELSAILKHAVEMNASDVLIVAGASVSYKIGGTLHREDSPRLMPEDTAGLCTEIYQIAKRPMTLLNETGDDDFSFSLQGMSRFRVNVLRQRGSMAAVIRLVSFTLPDRREIGIPDNVMQFANRSKGLVLVTGAAGSGKTTTLACLIDAINSTRCGHIITIEDPIEYLHRHKMSIVTQRELNIDTRSYDAALRAALRQAPDVILLGEMRDYDTIKAVITAAETGHLVISTLHTVGAANTVDRIIDIFPAEQQQQIRVQLAMVLQGVISQQLVPSTTDDKLVPAFEVMVANNAIRNIIRESKAHQIDTVIYSGAAEGMIAMDSSLFLLCKAGKITAATALHYANNPEQIQKRLVMAGLA